MGKNKAQLRLCHFEVLGIGHKGWNELGVLVLILANSLFDNQAGWKAKALTWKHACVTVSLMDTDFLMSLKVCSAMVATGGGGVKLEKLLNK